MSRPRVHASPRSATAIRFPTDLLARLHAESDARDVSVNWMVNRAVERFLADLLPVDQMVLTRSQPPPLVESVPGSGGLCESCGKPMREHGPRAECYPTADRVSAPPRAADREPANSVLNGGSAS